MSKYSLNDLMSTNARIVRFPLDELIGKGPVREREFRARLNALDLKPFRDKAVLVPWIHELEIPVWVYLMVAARLSPVAAVLSFGELCSPITLLQRGRMAMAEETGNIM